MNDEHTPPETEEVKRMRRRIAQYHHLMGRLAISQDKNHAWQLLRLSSRDAWRDVALNLESPAERSAMLSRKT